MIRECVHSAFIVNVDCLLLPSCGVCNELEVPLAMKTQSPHTRDVQLHAIIITSIHVNGTLLGMHTLRIKRREPRRGCEETFR